MKNKRKKVIKKQYGFVAPTIQPEDYFLGSGKLGSIVLNESGDWRNSLPLLEHQRKEYETQACVSFGTLSALEMLHIFQYNTEPNYSDRFLAKASDTDPYGGNTPNKVSDTLRKVGAVSEELYPYPSTLDEFYAEIPNNILSKGKSL